MSQVQRVKGFNMQTIEERVRELERSALRWRLATTILVTAVLTGVLAAPAKVEPKVIEADRLVFRDSTGNVRMELRGETTPSGLETFGLIFRAPSGDLIA